LTYIYGLGVIINLIANFILIPKYSYYGAAWTTLLTELVVTALMLVALSKILDKLPSFKLVFRYLLAGLMMVMVFYFLSNWPLFVLIILSTLIYFGFLYLIGEFKGLNLVFRKRN